MKTRSTGFLLAYPVDIETRDGPQRVYLKTTVQAPVRVVDDAAFFRVATQEGTHRTDVTAALVDGRPYIEVSHYRFMEMKRVGQPFFLKAIDEADIGDMPILWSGRAAMEARLQDHIASHVIYGDTLLSSRLVILEGSFAPNLGQSFGQTKEAAVVFDRLDLPYAYRYRPPDDGALLHKLKAPKPNHGRVAWMLGPESHMPDDWDVDTDAIVAARAVHVAARLVEKHPAMLQASHHPEVLTSAIGLTGLMNDVSCSVSPSEFVPAALDFCAMMADGTDPAARMLRFDMKTASTFADVRDQLDAAMPRFERDNTITLTQEDEDTFLALAP